MLLNKQRSMGVYSSSEFSWVRGLAIYQGNLKTMTQKMFGDLTVLKVSPLIGEDISSPMKRYLNGNLSNVWDNA